MEKQPEIKLQQVMVFGMCLFNPMSFYGFDGTYLIIDSDFHQIKTRCKTVHEAPYLKASRVFQVERLPSKTTARQRAHGHHGVPLHVGVYLDTAVPSQRITDQPGKGRGNLSFFR